MVADTGWAFLADTTHVRPHSGARNSVWESETRGGKVPEYGMDLLLLAFPSRADSASGVFRTGFGVSAHSAGDFLLNTSDFDRHFQLAGVKQDDP